MDELLTLEACTLPTTDRLLRLAEFDDLFVTAVRGVTEDEDCVRLELSGPQGLRALAEDLVERESSCCSFFHFTVVGDDDSIVLDISVPPAQRRTLAARADRARELAS